MKEIIESSIDSYIRKNKNTLGFGMFMLNGGGELTFRGNLLPFIQEKLNKSKPDYLVVAEYAPLPKDHFKNKWKNRRADLAILKRNENNAKIFDCVLIIELKINFTEQGASEVKRRHEADIEKWREFEDQKLFIHLIIEIKNNDEKLKCIGKKYIRAPDGEKKKQESIDSIFTRKLKTHHSEVKYPFEKTIFKTHVFLSE